VLKGKLMSVSKLQTQKLYQKLHFLALTNFETQM